MLECGLFICAAIPVRPMDSLNRLPDAKWRCFHILRPCASGSTPGAITGGGASWSETSSATTSSARDTSQFGLAGDALDLGHPFSSCADPVLDRPIQELLKGDPIPAHEQAAVDLECLGEVCLARLCAERSTALGLQGSEPATGKTVSLPREEITLSVSNGKFTSLTTAATEGAGVMGILSQLGVKLPAAQ